MQPAYLPWIAFREKIATIAEDFALKDKASACLDAFDAFDGFDALRSARVE